MTLSNQNSNNSISADEKKTLTLEEMDILCRKCHHLHDEAILTMLSGLFKRVKRIWAKELVEENNTLPNEA